MSIDASEYNSATANSSGGNRAPPPSFSSQSFAQGQRKRPALNNLGIEVSLASDVKTPNTPTPNLNNEILSSDNLLHTKPTPTPPHQNSHSGISYNYHSPFPSREDEFKEPQLLTILDALSDFQCHYDQKSQKIDTLEKQLRHLSSQLNIRENELQLASSERIENLKILELHKSQLNDLSLKLKDFDKYEALIGDRFQNMEKLMCEMRDSKVIFLKKESNLKSELGEKEKLLQESLRTIQELRVKKESLETDIETFGLESKEKYTEYNTKIYNLNLEIKDKTKLIEMLSGEKELLLSDLKNMTSDRDQIQKQCSNALKEITELAVSDPFGCASHDLGRLDVSVSWIKSKCLELNNENLSMILELSTLKQTIRELDDNFNSCKNDLTAMHKALENEKVKSENYSKQITNSEVKITELNEQNNDFIRFKEKISEILKVPNDLNVLDKAIEAISRPSNDSEIKSLNSEISKLKNEHEKSMNNQKEEYGRLLREETSKWKFQRDELETELQKLKKSQQQDQDKVSSSYSSQSSKLHEADLTAIIKDLKESSSGLVSVNNNSKRNSRSSSFLNKRSLSNEKVFGNSNNKRRTNTSSTTSNSIGSKPSSSQKISSPSSVTSNDIWSLFK